MLSIQRIYTAAAIVGTAALICIYAVDRSVFLDEANLIQNVVEKTYLQLLKPLDYDQSAPFGFTWCVKAVSSQGYHSLLFRLPVLLCAIAAVWLMRGLFLRLGLQYGGVLMLLFMGCHELVLQYGSECKQYGADLLATTLLLYMARRIHPTLHTKHTLCWIAVGALIQYLSMPSVMILAGIGCYWLSYSSSKTALLTVLGIGACWLIAFAFNYTLILKPGIASEHMQAYHQPYFFDISSWQIALSQLSILPKLIAKKTAVGIATATVLLCSGIWSVYHRHWQLLVLYLLPLVLTYLLSSLGLYSLLDRLLLFLLPIVLLLAAYGLDYVFSVRHRVVRGILSSALLAGLLVAVSHRQGYKWIHTHPYEDLRTVLLQLPSAIDAPLYLSKHAAPTYRYYSEVQPIVTHRPTLVSKGDPYILQELTAHLRDTSALWTILSHVDDLEYTTSQVHKVFSVVSTIESQGTKGLYIRPK